MTATSIIGSIALLDALTLTMQFGPYVGLFVLDVIAVTWRDRRTDVRLNERIQTLEEELDNVLLPHKEGPIGYFLEKYR